MKRSTAIIVGLVLGISALGLFILYRNRNPYQQYRPADIEQVINGEAAWYEQAILDYRIVVEVRFSSEYRQYELFVLSNQIDTATVKTWDVIEEIWGPTLLAGQEQVASFTVPGLFNLIRSGLQSEVVRKEIRVDIRPGLAIPDGSTQEPTLPWVAYFGPIWQDGELFEETAVVITVSEFEILP